jgi:tetratricopeptide (TPR) repeat protein
LDAGTGEVRAYRGTVHPDEAPNPAPDGEMTLYSAPAPSVENRFIPNAAHPGITPADVRRGAVRTTAGRQAGSLSEVAYQQTSRIGSARVTTQGEKVPWWKGGMWRNRKADKKDGGRGSAAKAPAPAKSAVSRNEEDLWDDSGDYDQSGYDPYASPNPADPYSPPRGNGYAAGPYDYAAPPVGQGGFVGDPYTLPNSPPPSSPYQAGYVYPGTQLSNETASPGGYSQPGYAAPPSHDYPAPADVGDNFIPPPPGGQPLMYGASSADAPTTSPQFDNAVRLVKDNRFGEAKAILLAETSRNPSSAASWRWLGDCQYNLLELESAINSYTRALEFDPNDYYALRGMGFARLHRGHEYWRNMQEVVRTDKERGAAIFAQAHENYKKALEQLGLCLRRAPNDGEAIYGEAMAAEGASRKLYSNAVSFLRLGPENRERAELFAENCLNVINKGIERAKERAGMSPGDSGPRALLGGLYLRKAILYQQLGKKDLALIELKSAHDVQKSILDEIDKNNVTAQRSVNECESYWNSWGGSQL